MFNRQEAFNTMVAHLRAQGRRAYDDGCRYRTDDGLKCAIGCLIPDDKYSTDFEGRSAGFVNILNILSLKKR